MGPAGRLVTIRRSGADGAHFPLSLSTCLFGRGVECDIRIQLPVVSRQHCRIEVGEQAVLFNLSSANPTQVNGAAIDGPVRLKHGDVITVVDRSFRGTGGRSKGCLVSEDSACPSCPMLGRLSSPLLAAVRRYEDGGHQSGSASAECPGQGHGQAAPRRASKSSFSPDPDGEVEGRGAARSRVTEEGASGERLAPTEGVGAALAVSCSSGGPATRSPPDGHRSEPLRDNRRSAVGSPAGGLGEGARGALVSRNGGPEALLSPWCLEKGGDRESPFRKLYESMKEKLDVKSEKENVLHSPGRSGSRGHCAADPERGGGSWGEMPLQGSPKCRRGSRRGSQTKAGPAPGWREEERTGEGPGPAPEATASPSVPPVETTGASTPVQCSHQNSSRKRRSGGRSGVPGGEPSDPEQSVAFAPKELFPGRGTPPQGGSARGFGNTPEKVFSRKRRSSLPPKVDILATETEIPEPAALSPLLVHVERKGPGGALGPPQPRGAAAGPPGLGSADVSSSDESTHKAEGVPLKTRRVSFGGHLRPELFDENLPPNTPLKRGETPTKRRSLVTHAPAVLKKIIKGQPQESGKGDSSEIRLEVTAQNVFVSSPAGHPARSPSVANVGRRRSSKPAAPSGSQSPPRPEAPKRRRSSGAPSQRASGERGRHGLLQMIQSRRRSGASEANLVVAKSWADVVKLSARPTQAKAVKRGPPRLPSKRPRRVKTPKKPTGRAYSEFSTGHANSPCTIVIGKAHVERVTVPARPYRMLNGLVFGKKIDFNEDLSGLTEMFKTPAREKPKRRSSCPTAFSSSEGESVFPGAQNAPEEPSDEECASPALRRQHMTVNTNMKTPPSETEPSKTAPSVNRRRRSVGRRDTQVPGTECGKEDPEFGTVQSISGGRLGKSPAQARRAEGEMEESEGASATRRRNLESEGNSEMRIVARRSRRSSELKGAPTANEITMKGLQETEPGEDLLGAHCSLQSPGHAEAPVAVESRATGTCGRSPTPEPVSTPAKANGRIKTPSRSVGAEALSVLRKPTQTPGGTQHTHKGPVGGDESMKASNTFSGQQQDSADHVTRSGRRSRTPKRKVQPTEDLAGLKELFQTPSHTDEPMTEDITTEIPSKSPKPEPASTPTSTKRRLRTPLGKLGLEEELSALREPTPAPGETTRSAGEPEGDAEDTGALKGTPGQKRDSAEHVTGSRRRSRTPKRKAEPTEDLTGFRELFQTPNHIVEPVTKDKAMKIPSRSPKPEPVSTPAKANGRIKTPSRSVGAEALSVLRKPTQTPGGTQHTHKGPVGGDESMKASNTFSGQQQDSANHVAGSRRRPRTPKKKLQPMEDLAGLKELFQTPKHTMETVTEDITTEIPSKSPKPEPVSTPTSTKRHLRTPLGKLGLEEELSALREPTPAPGETTRSAGEPEGDAEDTGALKGTPEQKRDSAEHVTGSRRRSRTPKRKVQPTEDLTGFKELFQTPSHTDEPMTEDITTEIPSRSPKPEPASTPTSTKRHLRTPLGKLGLEEELSALRESTPTPRGVTCSPRDPVRDDEDIGALKGTPEQKRDSAEHVTGSRRRSRTPKRKVEPTEDLAGLRELFRTPSHIVEPVTEDKAMKIPSRSPTPEPVSTPAKANGRIKTPSRSVGAEALSVLRKPTQTPGGTQHTHKGPVGGDESMKASNTFSGQQQDSADHVTRSGRRSRTPKRKVEPTEDLAGLKELFQTPSHTDEPMTEDITTEIPSKSPKPEPASTPTSTKRRLRTPLGKLGLEEELLSLREPTPAPGETTHSAGEPEGDAEDTGALKGTPEQKRDSAEQAAGSRRRSRTPKRKVEPTEDLTGFRELFQTPNHIVEPVTEDKAIKIPSRSPKPEPVSRPSSTKRHLRTPLGKLGLEEELSALRETTRSAGEPEGDAEDIGALKGTPGQKRDSAEHITGSRMRSRTPKRKVQPTEDLAGLKELFQTPSHTDEPMTEDITTEIPSKSPKPEPASTPTSTKRRLRTPLGKLGLEEELSALRETTESAGEPEGDAEDTGALKGTPGQKRDSAEQAAGSRRRSRTPKRKAEPTEDLTGLRELFQTPRHTVESVTEDKGTEMPRRSAQAKPAGTPSGGHRRLRAAPGKAAVKGELPALLSPARTSRRAARSHRELEGGDKDMRLLKESPEQKLHPAENVTASKRRPRTRKEKALTELLRTPSHTEDPVAVANSTEMPSGCPQAEAVVMPARTRRQLRAPPGTVAVQEEPSALRKPTGTSGKTTRSHREQEGADEDMKLLKESPEQKPGPAGSVTASKRKPRTRKEKAQCLEDPANLKELSKKPSHTEDPVAVANSTEMPSGCPQAEAVVMPVRTRRQLRAPPGTVAVQEEPSALRRPTGTSGKTTRSHREPVDGAEDIKVSTGPARREPGPVGKAVGSGRLLRSRKGKAQPPHSPAGSRQLPQSPARDKELGADAAGVTRPSTQAPDQSKPATTSRRALRAWDAKPTEELVDSRDPVKSPSESSVALSPKRKREDGTCAGPRRLRPRTRAQDPAEETPPRKRQRTAPREQSAPPDPSEPRKGRRVLRERVDPGDNLPSANGKTRDKGQKEDATSPDKGVSLCSGLPDKTSGTERRPEPLISAEKAQRKRNEKKPVNSSQAVETQNLEGGARNSAPGDKVHERRVSPRPARRGKVPVPRGTKENAWASSVETCGETREEKGGAPRSGVLCLRSRKVTVPPAGDTLESQSKQRVTRSAKRPVEDANKENEEEYVKKMRTRSRRGQ